MRSALLPLLVAGVVLASVAATAADLARALGADLGHSHLATHLELPLHVVLGLLAARQPALVLRITGDAHDCR